MRRKDHYQITGVIHLLSGTRVGGSDELLDIGATDLTVIKNPATMEPYLPGSSLKGKIRSQLESHFGLAGSNGDPVGGWNHGESPERYLVASIFGPHKNIRHQLGPTRIIVRDANLLSGGQLEVKSGVMINRNTGTAQPSALYKSERVASGSTFRLKIDLQVFDLDETTAAFEDKTGGEAMLDFVKLGLRLVELTGIGSGVSRGSGEVEFLDLKANGVSFSLPTKV